MPTSGKRPPQSRRSEVRTREDLAPDIKREMKRLGARLLQLRLERGLTQEQAAEAIGVHAKYMPRVEQGGANLSVATLVAMAKAYKVPLRDLFDDEEA